jgi:hypothetical protein
VTPERLAFLRGPAGGGRMLTAEECRELADAYEKARNALEREMSIRHRLHLALHEVRAIVAREVG